MPNYKLDHRTGGIILSLGYLLVLALLLATSQTGQSSVTGSPSDVFAFVLPPIIGVGSGLYIATDNPVRTPVAVLSGTYLGVMGVTLTFARSDLVYVTASLGLLAIAMAVIGLVGTLRSSLAHLVTDDFFGQ